jgi:hypothetical protein
MTLTASHLFMGPGEAKLSQGVIEAAHVFPPRGGVTALATRAELSPVLVLVAALALAAKSEISAAEVFHHNVMPGSGQDTLGAVAAITRQPGVAAIQRITGFAVVEILQAYVPSNRHKSYAVVFGVALDALVVVPVCAHQRRVQATIRRQPLPNLDVAGLALEPAVAAREDVTARAVCRTL